MASLLGLLLTTPGYTQDAEQQTMQDNAGIQENAGMQDHADQKAHDKSISEQEVIAAQDKWAEGIVDIGKVFSEKGDYKARAEQHIKDLYAYDISDVHTFNVGPVLYKPTLASYDQFRETFDQALSYFVGGEIAEDKGFAIKPWSKVRFGERHIVMSSDTATAFGNYFFTPVGSTEEVKVEYTFGYIKDKKGNVRINVHHSSLPFASE